MARIIEAFTQYSDGKGVPLSGGKLYFYQSSTTVAKATYSDRSQTQENTNPVILDGEGRVPDVWGTGSYKVILTDKNDNQIQEFDPVGGSADSLIPFSDWDSLISYQTDALVKGSDGNFHISLVDDNLDNNPVGDSGANWQRVGFINQPWASGESYYKGEFTFRNGKRYVSLVDDNQGNDPEALGANWARAEYQSGTNVVSGGGDTLLIYRPNVLTDSLTCDLPATAGVTVGDQVYCWVPDQYKAQSPVIEVADTLTETITTSLGTDTAITVDVSQSISFAFEYTGSGNWRLIL